jgi:hypothetical protein
MGDGDVPGDRERRLDACLRRERAPTGLENGPDVRLRVHEEEKGKALPASAGASRCSRTRATRWDRPRHLRLSARGGLAQYCRQGLGPWAFTLRSRGNPTRCRTPQAARDELYYNLPVGMWAGIAREVGENRLDSGTERCIASFDAGLSSSGRLRDRAVVCAGVRLPLARAGSAHGPRPVPGSRSPGAADAAARWPC